MEDFGAKTRKLLRSGNALVLQCETKPYFELFQDIITDCIPEPKEGSPRGIVICTDDQMARAFADYLEHRFRKLDLTLEYDAENMRITNCEAVNDYFHYEYRKGWEL